MSTKETYHGVAPVAAATVPARTGPVLPQPRLGPLDLPCSDGLPMADSDEQAATMTYSSYALGLHFRNRKDVYIAIDTFLYFWDRDLGKVINVAPDLMVVIGVDGHMRQSYSVWDEGDRVPDFVMEIVSPNVTRKELDDKQSIYERMGVTEYFVFDPWGVTAATVAGRRLHGRALRKGRYVPMEHGADGRVFSAALGLDLRVRRGGTGCAYRALRFSDPRTGQDLETHVKTHEKLLEAERRVAELEALLARGGKAGEVPSDAEDR